ncbi:hypothetical protein RUM43_014691 [Polyplax serrata]|uniref:Uncharacterized protein n=1 Tax=Polyplax serrata TaxID=468196 RepID=A0AAN8P4I1_POLSC
MDDEDGVRKWAIDNRIRSSDYGSCKDDDGVEEEEEEKDDDEDDDDDDNCNINDGKSLFSYVKRKSFALLQRVQRPRINGPPPRKLKRTVGETGRKMDGKNRGESVRPNVIFLLLKE